MSKMKRKLIRLFDLMKNNEVARGTGSVLKPNGILYIKRKKPNGRQFLKKIDFKIETTEVKPNETLLGGSQIAALKYIGKEFDNEGNRLDTPTTIDFLDNYGRMNLVTDDGNLEVYQKESKMFGVMFSMKNNASQILDKVFRYERGWNDTWNETSTPLKHPDGEELIPLQYFQDHEAEDVEAMFARGYCFRSLENNSANYYIKRIYPYVFQRAIGGADELTGMVHDDPLIKNLDCETVIRSEFTFDEDDGRDYFAIVKGNVHARSVSSIKFVHGVEYEVMIKGKKVRDFRRVFVSNIVPVTPIPIDKNDSIDFIYDIYM